MEQVERRCRELLREVPPEVTLVAAVKGRTSIEVRAALSAGVEHLGGNYVQEVQALAGELGPGPIWHMIGHLQRNKARRASEMLDWVQTVDSERLGAALSRAAGERTLQVLVQVNIGREPQKAGVLPDDVPGVARALVQLPGLALRGLMAIPPEPERPDDSRPHFRALRRLLEDLQAEVLPGAKLDVLSMGMTQDWRVAIEEGATMIRLGTALFGPR